MPLWPEFQDDPEAELEAREEYAAKRLHREYGWRYRLHPRDPERLDPPDDLDLTDRDTAGIEARLWAARGRSTD